MKTQILLFISLFFFSLTSKAQHNLQLPIVTPENYKSISVDRDIEVLIAPEVLLDSIITSELDGSDQFIFRKSLYDYYENGKLKSSESWFLDTYTNTLFMRNQYLYSYEGDDIVNETWFRSDDANSPLVNSYYFRKTYDENDLLIEQIQDRWNEDLAAWEYWYRTTVVENTPTFIKRNTYLWDESSSDYMLNNYSEETINGLESERTTFQQDVVGEYVATSKSYLKRNEFNNYIQDWKLSLFLGYTYEWETYYHLNYVYNNMDKTAIRTESRLPDIGVGGSLVTEDSFRIDYNEEWFRLADTLYTVDENDILQLDSRREYDLRPDGLRQQIRTFAFLNNDYEWTETIDYYYTEFINSIPELSEAPFPVQLTYPNPATKDDLILIKGTESNTTFDYSISNQLGQILEKGKTRAGDQLDLRALDGSGLYYITLYGEQSQRSWKVILQ